MPKKKKTQNFFFGRIDTSFICALNTGYYYGYCRTSIELYQLQDKILEAIFMFTFVVTQQFNV